MKEALGGCLGSYADPLEALEALEALETLECGKDPGAYNAVEEGILEVLVAMVVHFPMAMHQGEYECQV
jgi:hypothetical protein